MREFDEFMEVVREIRKKCPWDSVQTHESLKPYLMEEAEEVLEDTEAVSLSWEELKARERQNNTRISADEKTTAESPQ